MAAAALELFGLRLANVTLRDATEEVLARAEEGGRHVVFFVNAHCVNVAAKDGAYLRALHGASRLFADGSGMALAARLAGERLVDNVNGTDMFPPLCAEAARRGIPLAFLGAEPGIADRCAENMRAESPALEVPFVQHGYFRPEEEDALVTRLNASGARILLVAMGVPGQELWTSRRAADIRVPVLMGVGGLFDFYSGLRKRAPWLLRRTGMEWTFRLAQEPRRLFQRYVVGNPAFVARAVKLRLSGPEVLRSGGPAFAPAASR